MLIVHHACVETEIFSRRPDACYSEGSAAVLVQFVRGLKHGFAPQMGGIPKLHFIVIYVKIYRGIADTLENDSVIAGVFELRPEVSAGIGCADGSCKGSLGHYLIASAAAGCRSGQGSCHKDQFIVRSKGVNFWIHLVAEVLGSKTSGSHKVLCGFPVQRFLYDCLIFQIYS